MGKNMSGLFSSNTDEWATPQDLFDRLNEEFGFDLDVCANEENAKCPTFFTKEQDGLSKSWHGRRVFCNPPYDRRVGLFMKKAYEETAMGGGETICVMLVAARTDTKWWQDYAMQASEIRLIRGRLRFGGASSGAPFPSAIVIFGTPKYPRFLTYEV